MRNKSEKKPERKAFEVRAYRYVRQEATFTVEAADQDAAQEAAEETIDVGIEDLHWMQDYDCVPEYGFSLGEATPPPSLQTMSREDLSKGIKRLKNLRLRARRYDEKP